MAILDFCRWLTTEATKQKRGDRFIIHSDSESAIKALKARRASSKLVSECHSLIRKAEEKYHISIEWIGGHCDHTGNEWADSLAKEATTEASLGPEPFIPIPQAAVRNGLNAWLRTSWENEWFGRVDCRQSRAMVGKPRPTNVILAEDLDRVAIRRWVSFMTGHCKLRRHLAIVKEDTESPTHCRVCGDTEEDETPIHFLSCPALEYERKVMVAFLDILPFSIESFLLFVDSVERKVRKHDPLPVF
jgi:hypothetical protein